MKALFYFTVVSIIFSASLGLAQQHQASEQHNAQPKPTDSPAHIPIQHYGHFKKMVHKRQTGGVVSLQHALSATNSFALGAIKDGIGEVTVINDKVWLDYGHDGIGKSINTITEPEEAVLLAVSQVHKWNKIIIPKQLTAPELYTFIVTKASEQGINVNEPFPFLLEGVFDKLTIHVINGINPEFGGHGSGQPFYKQLKETRNNQEATVLGFYSANIQGVYTHPDESWHVHAVIEKENIGAHVEGMEVQKNTILQLPLD